MKHTLLLLSLLTLEVGLMQAQSKTQIKIRDKEDAIFYANTIATSIFFGKDNVITQRVTPAQAAALAEYMQNLKTYVQQGSPNLMKFYDQISSIAYDIVNALKITYNGFIAPALKRREDIAEGVKELTNQNSDSTKINEEALKKQASAFSKFYTTLTQIEQNLKKLKLTKQKQKDVQTSLQALAIYLEEGINKTLKNIQRIEEFVKSQFKTYKPAQKTSGQPIIGTHRGG